MITQEHHRFLAVGVDDVDHLFGKSADLLLLELDEVAELLARHAEHRVVVALVYNELGAELIACPLLELFKDVGADAGAVAEPLDEFLALLVVECQRELVEEGREPHHVNVGVRFAPAAQLFFDVGLRFGLAHIVGQLVRRILPVVGQEVVHVYGVPNKERQKADGVLVIGDCLNFDLTRWLIEEPFVGGYDLARRAVNNLPPALGVIQRVDFQLLGVEAIHQMDAQRCAARRVAITDEVLLLDFVGVCLRPGVVLAGRIIGSVLFGGVRQQFLRHFGAVAVAQRIRAQQIFQPQGLLDHIRVCGKCQSSGLLHLRYPFSVRFVCRSRHRFIDNIILVSACIEQYRCCCAFILSCFISACCRQHQKIKKKLHKK